MRRLPLLWTAMFLLASLVVGQEIAAQCPEEPPLQHYTGGGTVVCPCFVEREEAGAVLEAPAEHYPIEILRVGIGWGSMYGGTPQSLETAIHIYDQGLPNPGTRISSLEGPVLTDGVINEFNLEPLPGEITIDSGPFTVTLEFLNENAGNIYAPSMVHDGNGCQPGKNVVYAIPPSAWYDACALGVTGDWVVHVIYRQVNCLSGVEDEEYTLTNGGTAIAFAQPNPFSSGTEIVFYLAEEDHVSLAVYDVRGHRVTQLVDQVYAPGRHGVAWDGRSPARGRLPAGIYFVELRTGTTHMVKKVMMMK